MFLEIGYTKTKDDDSGFLYEPLNNNCFGVGFKTKLKSVVILNTGGDLSGIDMSLYKAIQKQIEELGWLSD